MSRRLREMFVLREDDGGIPGAGMDVGDTQPNRSSVPTPPKEASSGLRITGDVDTLRVLAEIIDESSGEAAAEYAEWINKATIALSQAIRKGSGNVTLPSYTPAPGLDSFDDDAGPGPDDEEI